MADDIPPGTSSKRHVDSHPVERALQRYLPMAAWLPEYHWQWLTVDLMAGVSVWAILAPESVAYASIAGVPAQVGLYAALCAVVCYALFGTSRQVITGPSATVAAESASVVAIVVSSGVRSAQWLAYTAALVVFVGGIYILLGALRIGWISNFLSKAVLGGFVFGFGIGLTIDQSHKILGVPKVSGSYWNELVGTIKECPRQTWRRC